MGGVLVLILVVFGLFCVVVLIRQFRPAPAPKMQYWDGPKPTQVEQQNNEQWIVEFLKQFPESDLAQTYPHLAKVAAASKEYDTLQELLEQNQISQSDYDQKVEKLLPLIDIAKDLK